ncbi:MAG: hypothetical protein II707_03945, partial [Spirochaetales bacterium]|nr:hypothetical protein [Spirochaetales bacterium]
KKLSILTILCLVATAIFADVSADLSVSTFFTAEQHSAVVNGDILPQMWVKYNAKNENSVESIAIPTTKYNNEDYSVYEVVTDERFFIPYKLNDESKLKFYNVLTSYSGLKGMQYYSRRAGKASLLIKKCYRVKSLSDEKLPDITYEKIEPKISNMFLQKDNKLGTLYFKNELFSDSDNFVMVNTCVIPITKALFTINDKNEYKIYSFFIYDAEAGGYFCYSFQVLRVKLDSVLKSGMISPTTSSNRLRASTVHLYKMLGIDKSDKLNPWVGLYDKY